MSRWSAWLRKDGWILAAALFCVMLCLMLGQQDNGALSGESRISKVLSAIQGAGQVEVAVHYEDNIPCGAVVVADGAGNAAVHIQLVSAVRTLLGIDQGRIAVYEREGSK